MKGQKKRKGSALRLQGRHIQGRRKKVPRLVPESRQARLARGASKLPKPVTAKAQANRPDIVKLPEGNDGARHFVVDGKLRALAGQMTQAMFAFMDLASEAIEQKHYVGMHYQNPEEYFGQRIGFSYRSLRRRLAIHESVKRLEAGEQDQARAALIELGIHRAAILAPVVGAAGQSWQTWVDRAKRLDEDQLQTAVTEALGAKRRGRPADERPADERWLASTLKAVPEDARDEVAEVFEAGLVAHETASRIAVFLYMIREVSVEWRHQAQAAGWRPKGGKAPQGDL